MKRLLLESIAQIVVWGIIAFVVGMAALIFAGTVGGVGAGVSPEFNFGLVERFVCPDGGKIVHEDGGATTWRDENGPHSGRITLVSCVAADGTKTEGTEAQAILAVIGLYFLICFVPLMLPGMLISWIIVHKIFGGIFKKAD
jgi:hypothetical protein